MSQQIQLTRVRICAYGDCYWIECDQNPLGERAQCWGCLQPCEAYKRLRAEFEAKFQRRLRELKERVRSEGGEVVSQGRAECLDCPERPYECKWDLRDPHAFERLSVPYVMARFGDEFRTIVWEGDEA